MNGEKTAPENTQQTNDLCREIMEIRIMIGHFIQLGYREEVASWRRILQAAKVSRRRQDHL